MNSKILDIILETIDVDQKYFSYKKEEFVRHFLLMAIEKNITTKALLKGSSFEFLLNKPSFRKLISKCGNSKITKEVIALEQLENLKHFKLSLGKWGEFEKHRNDDWYQTSLPGENLVLQMNFDLEHDLVYHKYFDTKEHGHPFTFDSHPISKRYNTLAWSRIDMNFETGEAFIEEIQNDWLRDAFQIHRSLKSKSEKKQKEHWITEYVSLDHLDKYIAFLKSYKSYWLEAMLMCSIKFIMEELGIYKIYYHTYESGNCFKKLNTCSPPKSLYSKLPEKFGFKKTDQLPLFWKEEHFLKKRIKNFREKVYCFDFNRIV